MTFDALILSGGRGRRLGGASKAGLLLNERSLLDHALSATHGARTVVVVGEGPPSDRYRLIRETPAFSGPVAAIAAGLRLLEADAAGHVLVLACDIPGAAAAVTTLTRWLHSDDHTDSDCAIAVDATGRDQYLLGLYACAALRVRLATMTVADAPMRQLLAGMTLHRVPVPPGSTDDVDTWEDAAALGVTRRGSDNHDR